MSQDHSFQLHERLAADTIDLGCSQLCKIRLMNDRAWPWILLVPACAGIQEIYELSESQQQRLMTESSMLSRSMMALFSGDKMNVAALGNRVPQLHVHHIVRFVGDSAWPGPVWGKQPPVPYTDEEIVGIKQLLAPILSRLA